MGSAVGYSTQPKKTQKTYLAIRQPPLRPPAWVFGPVWTMLYGTMGYAAHRATSIGLSSLNPNIRDITKTSQFLYTSQLVLNMIWMPLFFGIHRPALALVDIVLLTGNVGALAMVWSKVDKVAAWCMVPYLCWLGFATYINAGVGYLNGWEIKEAEKDDAKEE